MTSPLKPVHAGRYLLLSPRCLGWPQPVSHPLALRLLGLCTPRPRPAGTGRPPLAPLIGSAMANGVAVAGWAGAACAFPHRAASPHHSSLLSQPQHWACGETAFKKGHFTWSCSLSSARCLQSSAVPRSAHGVWACSQRERKGNRRKGRGHDRKGGDRRGAALDLLWISKSFPKCGSVCAASHSPGQEELRDRSRRCQPG